MSTHVPHPEHELAGLIVSRIKAIKKAHPEITFWTPLDSPSGKWEAEGPDWVIMERSPSRYAAALEARLPPPPEPKDVPGGKDSPPAPGDPGD